MQQKGERQFGWLGLEGLEVLGLVISERCAGVVLLRHCEGQSFSLFVATLY